MIGVTMALLLAQSKTEAKIEGIRRAFSGSPPEPHFYAFLGGLIVLAIIILILTQVRWKRTARPVSKHRYLEQAIDVMRLSEAERRVLLELAETSRIPEPTSMLLSPGNLAAAFKAALTSPLRPPEQQVSGVCESIFGAPMPPTR